jgi:hypothetical protein
MKKRKRTKALVIRLHPEELAEMQRQARVWERSLSEAVRAMFGLTKGVK